MKYEEGDTVILKDSRCSKKKCIVVIVEEHANKYNEYILKFTNSPFLVPFLVHELTIKRVRVLLLERNEF